MREQIIEKRRLASPATTPQALAWDSRNKTLWMGSRDLRRIYAIDPENGTVLKQQEAPGIPWAAVALNGELRFNIGEGAEDDRYIYRYTPESGFSKMFACPEFTGSYLSFDGKNLYMSQWYKKRVLKFDDKGNVIREINVGAEICGHTFANGSLYVLRGQEQPNEDWRIARVNPQEDSPCRIKSFLDCSTANANQSGSKFGNISSASASVLNGTQSQIAKNFSHIASTFGFLCAASIASCDFHSDTSMIVPSCARMMIGSRSVTSPSLHKVGTRLRTSLRSSVSFPGLGRYATITITLLIG